VAEQQIAGLIAVFLIPAGRLAPFRCIFERAARAEGASGSQPAASKIIGLPGSPFSLFQKK
jgi:hypothetical protein